MLALVPSSGYPSFRDDGSPGSLCRLRFVISAVQSKAVNLLFLDTHMIKTEHWNSIALGSLREPSPIFIVGAGRSGTTPVQLALNMHPQLGVYGETQAFIARKRFGCLADRFEFHRLVRYWNAIITEQTPYGDLLFDGHLQSRLAQGQTYADVMNIIMSALAARDGKSRWGEKTPAHVFWLDDIAGSFPNARVIHMVRDPRAVVCSSIHAFGDGQLTDWAIYRATKYWQRCVRINREYTGKDDGRHKLVRYEEFVAAPHRTLSDVCAFLKVDFVEEMLDFYKTAKRYVRKDRAGNLPPRHALTERPADASRAYAWKEVLSSRQIAMIEHLVRDDMRFLGYEPAASNSLSRVRSACFSTLWRMTENRRIVTREARARYWAVQRIIGAGRVPAA